jgi:hypothetical protein
MAFKKDGRWYPTAIAGALMIRPILSKFIGVPTGIAESTNKNQQDFSVYPNPANRELHVGLNQLENYNIKLIDLTGKEVSKLMANGQTIDLPELAEGFYLLVFENSQTQQKFVKKIIIKQ